MYVRQTRSRNKFYLAVRLVSMALVLLALLGVSINRRNGTNATIFLVDISNSNEQNLKDMEAYLEDVLGEMPRGNQYGIITFGKNSQVEQFLTGKIILPRSCPCRIRRPRILKMPSYLG